MEWRESKDAGKQSFSGGNYPEALASYTRAIDQLLASSDEREGGSAVGQNANEHQILLSNAIACRLKIGGPSMATQAVEDAKKCVALNNRWPKAHVRLASAYIALGGHSNDACLSLQRALSLDRSNKVAREMLVKEMRRRNTRESGAANGEGGGAGASNGSPPSSQNADYHPTEETPQHSYPGASAPPHPSQSTHEHSSSNDGIDVDDIDPPNAYYSLPFSQRVQHHFAQYTTWFYSQSGDIQTLVKVACVLLILYVALGGRFGLNYALGGDKGMGRRGNYGEGNAYDKYYSSSYSTQRGDRYRDGYASSGEPATSRRQQQHAQRQTSSGYNDRTNPQNDGYYSRYENEHYYEPRRGHSTSYHMPNLFDGSMVSMAILLGVGILCHRFGISPWQAMWMLNLMQGRGRRRMGGWGYGAYPGGGGFGFGRRQYGFGRRGRGGYW